MARKWMQCCVFFGKCFKKDMERAAALLAGHLYCDRSTLFPYQEPRSQKRLRFFFFDPSWNTSASLCSGGGNRPALTSSSTSSEISCADSEGVWLGALSVGGEGLSCCSKFAILSSSSLTAPSCVRFSSSRIWTRSFLSIPSFSARAFSSRILVLSSSDLRFSSRRLDSSFGPVFVC